MNSHYIFSFKFEEKKNVTSYTVIFFPLNNNPDIDLDDAIKEYFTNNSPKDHSILIFPNFQEELVMGMIKSSAAPIKRLKGFTYHQSVKLFSYDLSGRITELGNPTEKKNIKFIKALKKEGLVEIFRKRMGLLECDETFHYILPSGSHSRLFIRIGNILTCGNEVNFIAFCLLPFFKESPEYIYCDSASISSIAYAIIIMHSKFASANSIQFKLPHVESFGGYEKLKDYSFKPDNIIILISTSTSGAMKKELINIHKIEESSIVTLYYNGNTDGDNNILVNLKDAYLKDWKTSLSFERFNNEIDCKYCNSNSIPVKLSGDQFLPAKSVIERILVERKHRPIWLNNFMEQFYSTEIIKCHYGNVAPKIREFYLDLEKVHSKINIDFEPIKVKEINRKKKSYATEFYKFLENHLPITVEKIICLPDPASKQMATQIQEYLKNRNSSADIIEFSEFIKGTKTIENDSRGTILVLSSSIATGKKLYQLSLKFRDYDNISVFYFFGICRTPTKELLETLRTDLTYRKDIININKLDFVESINIPDRHTDFGKELENSPWMYEKNFIIENLRPFYLKEKIDYSLLEERIQLINHAESNLGMNKNLFWPKVNSKEDLILRKNFAFWDFDYSADPTRKASQSDVYFTISAILHNLRSSNEEGKYKLFQHEYKRSILAPQTFTRYSDGIIQACFLRGAQPGELNYSIDFNISYDMKKILLSIFNDSNSDDSEALYEFLYAISIKKLKLLDRDIIDFLKTIETTFKKNLHAIALCKYIRQYNFK